MVQWLNQNRRGAAQVGAVRWSVAAIFLLALVQPALAGVTTNDDSRAAVERELERTEQVIEKAREQLQETTAEVAHRHLKTAIDLQAQAKQRFFSDVALRQVVHLTVQARQEAIKALDAARAEKMTQENVRRAIERAEERALEVGEQVRTSRLAQARQIFDQGLDQLSGARRANRDRHYAQAQRMADLAISLINRAGRMTQEIAADAAAVETALEKSRTLLEQAREAARMHGRGSPQLDEAQSLLQRAQQELRAGQLQRAMQLNAAARQKVLQVLARFDHEPTAAFVEESIEEVITLMEEVGPKVEAEGSDAARRHLAEARKRLRRAQELLREGDSRQALERLAAARNLLLRAAKSVGLR